MHRLTFFTLCFYVQAAMKVPGPALAKVAGKKDGDVEGVTKIRLGIVSIVHTLCKRLSAGKGYRKTNYRRSEHGRKLQLLHKAQYCTQYC